MQLDFGEGVVSGMQNQAHQIITRKIKDTGILHGSAIMPTSTGVRENNCITNNY